MLTHKNAPRTERINRCMITVDPQHRYSKEQKELAKTFMMILKIHPFSARDRLCVSASDVCRRQMLTHKDAPRTERINRCMITVDPQHRYSNEAEIAS